MTQGGSVAIDGGTRSATRLNVTVWAGMLAIVGIEVAVTFARPSMPTLIGALLILAIAQASLGVMYFMHLRHERAILGWSLISALVFVLVLMNQFWFDALRVFRLRVHQ
jgi:caa(3)-type oxidase subunit IV